MVALQGYATFPCPSCGGALPATMPAGLTFACPLCQGAVTVPLGAGPTLAQADAYQAWAVVQGNTAAALADRQAPGAAARPFASTSAPVAVEDGAGGLLVIGAQVEAGRGWRLRALDAIDRSVRWEALDGAHFQTCPSWRTLCGRGGRVYLAHEGRLVAIDARGGAVAWEASLPARVATREERAALAGDTTELYDAGPALVVRTEDGVLHGFDRATGRPRWRRGCERPSRAAGELIVLEDSDGTVTFVRAADGTDVARFTAGEYRCAAIAASGFLLGAEDQGEDEVDGCAFVDASGARRWFAPIEVNLSPGVVELGGELLAVVGGNHGDSLVPLSPSDGLPKRGFFARLFGGAPARRALPWPKQLVDQMWGVGDALVVQTNVIDGGKRIAVLDPRTMAIRHDSGDVPDGVAPGTRIGPGLVIYSFGTTNGPKDVRAVDPVTGALRWERRFDDLDEILFRGDRLVLATTGGPLEIADPATGRTLATW